MSSRGSGGNGTTEADKAKCDICCSDRFPESLLSCNRCITVQHTFCLPIPLVALPGPRWSCAACSESSLRSYPSRKRRLANGGTGGGHASAQPSSNGVAISNGSRANGSQANGAVANGSRANGAIANGSQPNGSRSNGAVANGAIANGNANVPHPAEVRKRAKTSPEGAAGVTSTDTAPASDSSVPARPSGARSPDTESEPYDPGTTITIFCRRDMNRYLRWKWRELANQDNERKREEETRSRKTFSSIIANSKS